MIKGSGDPTVYLKTIQKRDYIYFYVLKRRRMMWNIVVAGPGGFYLLEGSSLLEWECTGVGLIWDGFHLEEEFGGYTSCKVEDFHRSH